MTEPVKSLRDAAQTLGGHCWVERQIFEVAGRWVPLTPPHPAKLALDRHSGHSAWRAQQWEQRLPVLAGVDRPSLIQPPDEGWRRSLAALGELEGTPQRLAGLYRVVLPRLAVRYRAHLAASSPSAEGPSRRSLHIALADLAADSDEGDDLLVALLDDQVSVQAAAHAAVQVESAFLGPAPFT